MCRDIHKWMDNSTLSNDDLEDDFCPIYYITKSNNSSNAEIITFEYLKVFIHTDKEGIKIAFIQKGLDYSKIERYINELIDNEIIKDLLNDSNYLAPLAATAALIHANAAKSASRGGPISAESIIPEIAGAITQILR